MPQFKLSRTCLSPTSPKLSTLTSSFRVFFSYRAVLCTLVYSSCFAGCSFPMFFRLVVPHINGRTWLIYGRLSGHQMFGTNHVVFTWLPPFPCFRIFSIDGFNPRYSPFRVSFKCSKGLKLKQFRHVQSWLARWQICVEQNPATAFLQLIYTATATHNSTNPHILT